TNSVFHDNEIGATAVHLIENCEFYNHSDRGATVTGADRKMIGCLIHDNVIGVQTHNVSGTQFIDNVVYSNDIGVRMVTFFNDPGILFHSNKICHNTTWDLEYGHSNNADLSNNCWCSIEPDTISAHIRDGYDDISYGLVTFSPFDVCAVALSVGSEDIPEVSIYPNPATDFVSVVVNSGILNDLTIVDLQGRVVLRQKVTLNQFNIDVSSLSSG